MLSKMATSRGGLTSKDTKNISFVRDLYIRNIHQFPISYDVHYIWETWKESLTCLESKATIPSPTKSLFFFSSSALVPCLGHNRQLVDLRATWTSTYSWWAYTLNLWWTLSGFRNSSESWDLLAENHRKWHPMLTDELDRAMEGKK